MSPPGTYAVRMCAARSSSCSNGCAEEAAAAGPITASRVPGRAQAGPHTLHSLEMGTVMTVFYQKKSQRPERRTFQIKPDTRLLVWSRNPDKSEGESEYQQAGRAGTGPTPPRTSCSWCSSTDRPVLAQLHTTSDKPSWFLVVDHTAGEAASGSSGSSG